MNTVQQTSLTEALGQSGLESIDYIIFFVYIVMLVSLGMFLSYSRSSKDANGYFLADNTLTWWAVGTSLIVANISAEQFIGTAGTGYVDGLSIAAYEIMSVVALILIGKFLLPIMMSRNVFTMPQFLRTRYNSGVGLSFSVLWIFLYVFINLTSVAWLGALAIEQIIGLQGLAIPIGSVAVSVRMLIIIFLFLIAGVYSIYGGMASVAWTDVMQFTFIVGGGLATAYFAVQAVAGDGGTFTEGFRKLCVFFDDYEYKHETYFHLIVPKSRNPQAYNSIPGIAAIVGGIWLTNLSYWGFNQYITQKGLAARSVREGQQGFIFAAFFKLIVPVIVLVPVICARYIKIYGDDSATLGSFINISDDAYPWLIRNFIPVGIKGLSVVALTAAVTSSLASILNSTATIFTMDIYQRYINRQASDKKLVNIGRLSAVVALCVAIFSAAPLLGSVDQAFQYIQEYSGFLYPGLTIVFGFGLLWKRASSMASIWVTILTVPLGVLFKLLFPEVSFVARIGHVFIVLVIVFITISLLSRKVQPSQTIYKKSRELMKKWGMIIGGVGGVSILAATIVTIGSYLVPEGATPDNNIILYLDDISFQSLFFFGFFCGACGLLLLSNARGKWQDPKALPINLALFHTTRGYAISSIIICLITLLLYVFLW